MSAPGRPARDAAAAACRNAEHELRDLMRRLRALRFPVNDGTSRVASDRIYRALKDIARASEHCSKAADSLYAEPKEDRR